MGIYLTCVFMQDSSKINDLTKECEDSRNIIPKLQENIPKLQEVLVDEEKVLEEIKEKAKGVFFFSVVCPLMITFLPNPGSFFNNIAVKRTWNWQPVKQTSTHYNVS